VTAGADPLERKGGRSLSLLLHWSFGLASAAVLAVLVVLTFADVGGRYFFNKPVYGAYELIEILMGALIFTALPVITLADRHITIDLLDSVTPQWVVPWRDFSVSLLSAVALAVIAWQLYVHANDKASYNDVTTFLRIPQAPVIFGMAVLAGSSAVAAGIGAFAALRKRSSQLPK
jgi:TRAP-type C4-dicarboxylate transport system permease small subunit